jgi:hypothetical protein
MGLSQVIQRATQQLRLDLHSSFRISVIKNVWRVILKWGGAPSWMNHKHALVCSGTSFNRRGRVLRYITTNCPSTDNKEDLLVLSLIMLSHTLIETPCLVMRWYSPTWILTCPNSLSRMFKTLSGTNTTSPVNGTKSRPYARYNGMMDRKCIECRRSTHFHLVPRSNKSGVIPLLPSHAYKTCKTTAYFHIHRQAAAVKWQKSSRRRCRWYECRSFWRWTRQSNG